MWSCECESVTPTKRVKYLQQRHDRYQDRCQCGSCLWHGQWCPSVPQNDLPLCCPGKTCSPPLHRTEVYSQQYLSLYPFQRKSTLKSLKILWYSVSGDQSKWFLSVWFRVLKMWSVSNSSWDFGISAGMMHFHKSIIFYKMLFNNLPCANVAFLISKWDHEINSKTEHSIGLKSFFIGEVMWVTKEKARLECRWILQSTKWLSNHKYVMKRHKSLAYW